MASNELTYEIDDTGPIWVDDGLERWLENFVPIPVDGMHYFWRLEALFVRGQIAADVRVKRGNHNLTLKGHSRGGAVAMYVARMLVDDSDFVDIRADITGAPCMWFGKRGAEHDRMVRAHCTVTSVVATSDPVTWVPPGWRHTESEVIDSGRWPRFKHHHPDHYEQAR